MLFNVNCNNNNIISMYQIDIALWLQNGEYSNVALSISYVNISIKDKERIHKYHKYMLIYFIISFIFFFENQHQILLFNVFFSFSLLRSFSFEDLYLMALRERERKWSFYLFKHNFRSNITILKKFKHNTRMLFGNIFSFYDSFFYNFFQMKLLNSGFNNYQDTLKN